MAGAMMATGSGRGVTLLELLVVLAIIGILVTAGSWGTAEVVQRWQAWRGGQQILEDIKEAQARAERGSGFVFSEGALVMARSYLVFEPEARRYGLYDWHDVDGDGHPETGESRRIWSRELPPAVQFGWAAGIGHKACSNAAGPPGAAITFGTASYPPCAGRPCLKFDQQGFSTIGPGAVYLVDGAQSYALTATRPGHLTLCRWDGQQWR
jgi:prepilin-type N-terminal cleavage/methylation domain-containing protein